MYNNYLGKNKRSNSLDTNAFPRLEKKRSRSLDENIELDSSIEGSLNNETEHCKILIISFKTAARRLKSVKLYPYVLFFIDEENWGNKNPNANTTRRGQKSYLNPSMGISAPMVVLSNGFISRGKLQISNTCSFDAAYHIFCALYADSKVIKSKIDKSPSKFSNMISMMFSDVSTNEKLKNLNKIRNEILMNIYKNRIVTFKMV